MIHKNKKEIEKKIPGEILLLTIGGSHLFGTENETSDIDLRGVYLPDKNKLLLGDGCRNINFKFDNNIDVDMWSLQNFYKKFLRAGESTALDLYFSDCALHIPKYKHPDYDTLPLNCFLDTKVFLKGGYYKYAYTQAIKYGIKGERLSVLKQVYDYIIKISDDDLLSEHINDIINLGLNKKYVYVTASGNIENALFVCGRIHHDTIKMKEFKARLEKNLIAYGDRSWKSMNGNDWKALSHSLRALFQFEELLTKQHITFPLADVLTLKGIKNGYFDIKTTQHLLETTLKKIDNLILTSEYNGSYNESMINEFILSFYK